MPPPHRSGPPATRGWAVLGPQSLFRTPGATKPPARRFFGLDRAPVLGDPYFRVGFGRERADLGRVALRNTDLHSECSAATGDHPIHRLGVWVAPLCLWLARHRQSCSNTAVVKASCYQHWCNHGVPSPLTRWGRSGLDHGVRCSAAPIRGAGSSSRTRNTPPAVSALDPWHHRATKALASVAFAK